MKKFLGIIFVLIGLCIILFVLYQNSQYSTVTRQFSPYTLLSSSWEQYKTKFINQDGRVIDYTQQGITTSEGQSYAMLRSVWSDDRQTFDSVWKWTRENLHREDDHLFGWRWGKRNDGRYGFIEGGGENNATDADQDIALALLLASARWKEPSYTAQAKPIITDIWRYNTALAAGERYLIAGRWAENRTELVINPSYFTPYAWRIFATVDSAHDWQSLIPPAYTLLTDSGTAPLHSERGVGLPPDWLVLNRQTGVLSAPTISDLKTTYSFDAIRVPWRIALDYQWSGDERARKYLMQSFRFLANTYRNNGKLDMSYYHDGSVSQSAESPSIYATSIGYFMLTDKDTAEQIYQNKIIRLYANGQNGFRQDLPYYEQNWLWFGAAMYNNYLNNFGLLSK